MTDPRREYTRRLTAWRARVAEFERTHLLMSNGRLALAGTLALTLWLAYISARIAPWWPVAVGVAFGALAVVHARLLNRRDRAQRAVLVYQRGFDRLDDRWAGGGRGGAAFQTDHPYARDLDLFGRASLFELLNTARTEAGEVTLADWLREGTPLDEVRARQAAVAELARLIDFREDVAILAAESPIGRTGALASWAASPSVNFPGFLRELFAAFALATVTLAVLVYLDRIEAVWLTTWVLVETGIAAIWHKPVHQVLHAAETPEHDLGLLSELLARIEREAFESPRLASLRESLNRGDVGASHRIARLRKVVAWSDATHNILFGPIAFVLLVRQQVAIAIDRWHRAHARDVAAWLAAVGDAEALSALGTYAFERPADPFPAVEEAGPLFDAQSLGHPLIAEAVSVRNDVRLGGGGPRALVISGSNMSGKSTLLRSVGLNVVLALAGAPVRAASMRVSRLALGATLRIDDSLEEGRSRFYAEILRIRSLVDTARGPVPLLFLLDEILHGTNSHDRRIGAEAIVRALVGLGAIGLVTTHDLALTELPARLEGLVNMHFEDRLEDGRMVFDYRMRAGVVEHSNALALMRAVGLDV